jgi:hypothetical protein
MNKAVVSTCPTPEGNTIIDPYHQLSGVKWLREKPLDKFVDAQWLLIQKAEDEKLLKVIVKLPKDGKKELMSGACENYLSDCVSKSTQLCDEQQKMILGCLLQFPSSINGKGGSITVDSKRQTLTPDGVCKTVVEQGNCCSLEEERGC